METSKDPSGQTLTHLAADAINTSAVLSLIALNVAQKHVNIGDNYNMTPMHIAAINFDIEIFNNLANLKPNVDIKDIEGKTCIDYLNENEEIDKEILKYVENIKL